jgi:predicted  nucleic acid-binding Zn-ribbon protein
LEEERLSAFEALLEVQDRDTAVDRLRHRRDTLPERAELAGVEQTRAAIAAELAGQAEARDEAARRLKRLEDETAGLIDKITEVEKKLYSGAIAAPRELQALQADIESLKRHKSSLEDQTIEAMEVLEPLDRDVDRLETEQARLDEEAASLRVRLGDAESAIDAEVASEMSTRAEQAAGIPEELLGLYDQIRTKSGGIGVARLVSGSCTGCHLALPAMEVARIHREPADSLVRCDQCSRILVR